MESSSAALLHVEDLPNRSVDGHQNVTTPDPMLGANLDLRVGTNEAFAHPTSRKRVAQLNDDVDVLHEQRPELAIIDRATWDPARLQEAVEVATALVKAQRVRD